MTEKTLHKASAEETNGSVATDDRLKDEEKKKKSPIVKAYTNRNSVLTDLMEVSHVQTVYNMSVAVCGLLALNTVLYYLADPDTLYHDLQLMAWGAGKMHIFVATWIGLNVVCICTHRVFCIWAQYRHKLPLLLSDFLFILYFICVLIGMFTITPYIAINAVLRPITSFALLAEQVRIFMKIYSFVIENYSKVKRVDIKDKIRKKDLCPSFNHFMYYMFVPVLIYRDSYPRTLTRSWSIVAANFAKVIGCIFITYCLFLRFNVDVFSKVGLKTFTYAELVLMLTGCMAVGSLMMFLIFYAVLHAWLNAFAEMMRFGDRQFYKDWWNSTSFSQYYRMWNGVVYDWIYTYVYIHLCKLGFSKWIAMMMVLVASSLFHDYIICTALGYFFPALGVVYSTIGFLAVLVTRNKTSQTWNTFLWAMLFGGWGVLIFSFTMEWYARQNCPSTIEGPWQYIVPRSLSCQLLTSSKNI